MRVVAAQEAREYAESIIETVREPLIVLDSHLRVKTASRAFYKVYKVSPEEIKGKLIYDLGNRQWDIPKLRKLLAEIIPMNNQFLPLGFARHFF
jgi:two-component system CheB/CheR fusion protein